MVAISNLSENSFQLSKVFHEIKNPLTLISSSLQLIEKEHPEVIDFQFWGQTKKDVSLLCTLINDLSAYQQCSLLKTDQIHLSDFIEEILASAKAFLLEGKHALHLQTNIRNVTLRGDGVKLRQALINLLKNAVESSQEGSPILLKITVGANRLFFFVADKGQGMSKEQMSHLYEPFYTTKPYGTGLGLIISRQIIHAHGGSMHVLSKQGSGTVFCFSLPLS